MSEKDPDLIQVSLEAAKDNLILAKMVLEGLAFAIEYGEL